MKQEKILKTLLEKLIAEKKISFKAKIIPRSKKTKLIGWYKEKTLKFKIAAIPEHGKANAELLYFLSILFEVPQKNVVLKQGAASVLKTIEIRL